MGTNVGKSDLGLIVSGAALFIGIAAKVISEYQNKRNEQSNQNRQNVNQPKLTFVEAEGYYSYKDATTGESVINTDGYGTLVAQSYNGSDGQTYLVDANNDLFVWDNYARRWVSV